MAVLSKANVTKHKEKRAKHAGRRATGEGSSPRREAGPQLRPRATSSRKHVRLIGAFRPHNGSKFDQFLGYKRIRFKDGT